MGPKTTYRSRNSGALWMWAVGALVIAAGLWIGLRPARAAVPPQAAQEQAAPAAAPAAAAAKPAVQATTCQNCHQGIENYHTSATAANIACTKCHGGNGEGKTQAEAHVLPRKGSIFYGRKGALPTDSYALLNLESTEYIQFVNPSDFRVADKTCGPCHKQITASVKKNIMATNAMVHNAVFYNNGSVPFKVAHYGEAYTPNGKAASIIPNPPPTREAQDRGALKQLFPHPNFEVTKIVDPLRVAEVDQAALGNRGPGTQGRIEGTFLNVLKTRLNDPTLWFMGPNTIAGDYRASGCDGCHMIYANSRDETARDYAKYGNTGQSATGDKNIPKGVSGYPIKHQVTTAMPPVQCLTCHYHQGNGALDTYVGAVWWDRESDSDIVKKLKAEDEYGPGQNELATHNGEMKHVQFTDYHAHGWNFQKVYKMDVKGQLLDAKGQVIPDNDPDKFKKAVHLKDIHFEKGMDCVDCHTKQDMHGDGNMYAQMTDAIEIRCEDCHGTVDHRATLITSGMGANGKHDLQDLSTPTGGPQFEMDGDKVIQHSMRDPNLQWEIKQVVDIVNPASPVYNPKAAYAKLMTTSGTVGSASAGPDGLAHSTKKMECYACHSSWQTTCSGCHLPLDVNKKTRELHFEPTMSKAYAPYYRQVIRTDLNFLGIGTYNHGYKVTPFRPASAVVVSALDGDRNNIIHQQPLVSSPGFNNDGFTPHPPHTVRTQETKECSDCHLSQDNSNNARIASNLGFGINAMNFIGEFQYIAEKGSGLRAVKVTEGDEPQPVIGSTFDKVLYPESYNRFVSGGRKLRTSYRRRAPLIQALTVRGEYVLTAEGPAGYKLYDIANINNKAAAQRIVQHQNTGLGEHTVVRSPNATYIYVPSSLPMALGRPVVAANHEQPIHPLYRYAYCTDSKDGLVLIDINTLTDIDPENNRLKRNVVFNPDGKLTGAQMVKTYGHYAFVVSDQTGLSVVNIDDPTKPKLAFSSNTGLDGAHTIELQLRYAFVLDRAGLKVFDITNPEQPVPVQGATVTMPDTHGMTLFRTTAYIAAGKQGLAMVDVTDPEKPGAPTFFNAGGAISDARDVAVGETNVSFFAYVADGKGGMKIVKLIDTDSPGYMGFAATPQPELIASYQGAGETVAVWRGMIRDRYVDESGDQIAVTNRMGSRPFNAEELHRILFMPDGKVLKVTNEPPSAKAEQKTAGTAAPGGGTR